MKIAYNCGFYLNVKDEKEIDDKDFVDAFDEIERNLKKYIEIEVIS